MKRVQIIAAAAIAMVSFLLGIETPLATAESPIEKGKTASDFTLPAAAGTLEGDITLSDVYAGGPTIVIVLRGYPGYQCPLCSRQVGDFIRNADKFADKNATVLFIYPGEATGLSERAAEFTKGTNLPSPLTLLLDPDYEFTNQYGLRWDAANETAYPAAMLIEKGGKIKAFKISESHGGRVSAADALAQL